MSKLAKGLLGAFVLAACAVGGDDNPSIATVELAIVAPAALPGGMGPRLQKTCAATFPPGVERVLYGPGGAPKELTAPHRVIPSAAARSLRVVNGSIALEPAAERVGLVASARVSALANGSSVLTSPDGAMQIAPNLRGTRPVSAQASDGLVVYPGGHADGDVVVRPRDDGAEDWVLLTRPPTGNAVEYDVALTNGVAAIRKVANTVEFLDAAGTPRLRMAPPSLVDADCKTVAVDVTVTGCAVDTDGASPYGKRHPAPGSTSCRIALSWPPAAVKYPVSLDPTWSSTKEMVTSRAFHTAQKLEDPEEVFVTGGITWPGGTVLDTTEVYHVDGVGAATWSASSPMATGRYSLASSRFVDPVIPGSASVFVAGGIVAGGTPTVSTELWNRSTGTWTTRAPLLTPTAGHTVDVFASDWAYIAGGWTFNGAVWSATAATAAYYRPGNTYYYTPPFAAGRGWHSSVVNSEGIYFFGGERNVSGSSAPPIAEVQRYNPGAPNNITTMPAMLTARSKADAVLFGTKMFVAGGESTTAGVPTSAVETLTVPSPTAWSASAAMASGRFHAKTALRSTGPIVTGGYDGVGPTAATTIYDSFDVALAGPLMATARYAHTATALSNDRVLVVGGMNTTSTSTNLAEILVSAACTTAAECDDGNPCTVDTCGGAGRCVNMPLAVNTSCDDGNVCNGVDKCTASGTCAQAIAPITGACSTCDPIAGASTKPAGAACSLPSFVAECKTSGHCTGASPADSACVAQIAPDGTSCGSTNVCTGVSVCTSGSCAPRPGISALADVHDPCVMTTCDPNLGIVSARNASCGVVNPAPPASQTTSTTFEGSTDFLTASGGQLGVSLDVARRAVVRGYAKVLDANGSPTTDPVTVTVKGHSWGSTTTDGSGAYALAVEGGGDLVLTFTAPGHITADRHAQTKWHRYTVLDDVMLVAQEPVQTVTLSTTAYAFAEGNPHGGATVGTDGAPSRKATVFFPPNLSAQNLPANTFGLRITELTAFPSGPRAMPASLPPASGYTYAFDVSVEGVPEGTDVVWTSAEVPVVYVDNFIGVPNGDSVPVGYYDRAKSAWVPEPNGVAIQIESYDGTGHAVLLAGGPTLTTAERKALGDRYAPALKKLWRVPLKHFSVWDCNWGFGPPNNAVPPPIAKDDGPTPDAPTCRGSILECANQVLGEDIPIAGTPYSLHYRSDRTGLAYRTVRVPLTDGRELGPTGLQRIDVEIEVAGQRALISRVNSPEAPIQKWDTLEWTWDRKDAFGAPVEGSAVATTVVRYIYAGSIGVHGDLRAVRRCPGHGLSKPGQS